MKECKQHFHAKDLKRLASDRQRTKREIDQRRIKATTLDSISAKIKEGSIKTLPLVIKGDVDGSIEALSQTLEKIKNDEVGIQVIHKSVGIVTESDVLLAAASGAVIIAFHVQVDSNAKLQARQEGVDIRSYSVIYNVEEELKLALEGLLEPETKEEVLGRAVVLEMFKIPKQGFIAGSVAFLSHLELPFPEYQTSPKEMKWKKKLKIWRKILLT